MYFIRSLEQLDLSPAGKMKLDQYLDQFLFRSQIYKDKISEYDAFVKGNSILHSDLAAAVITAMFKSGYIHKASFAKGLSCCRDIIQDLGFAETDDDLLHDALGSKSDVANVVMVAGCQNDDMLAKRVAKAVAFTHELNRHFTIVFSGGNPDRSGSQPVSIPNESTRMLVIFKALLKAKNTHVELPKMSLLTAENGSSTTKSNIREFFTGPYLDPVKPNNVIIVSSTFHLIRLARELTEYLSENAPKAKIRNVILVGAEGIETQFVITDAPYIKLMMFDVFDYLVRKGAFSTKGTEGELHQTQASGD